MTVAGLVFSNIHDSELPEMTPIRTMASVPFGGRYRLIDFPLSQMVNADIIKIGVITHYNYQSLLDHIGNGKDWDLARRSGGIKVLPPFITAYDNSVASKSYENRLEALLGVMNFINKCTEDHIVLSDCNAVMNVNLKEVIEKHEENMADITIVTKKVSSGDGEISPRTGVVKSDGNGKVTDFSIYTRDVGDRDVKVCTNLLVIKRTYLQSMLFNASAHGYKSFYRDIIGRAVGHDRVFEYEYTGEYMCINSLKSYFKNSMRLLDVNCMRHLLSDQNMPIYTKVRNSAPTKYYSNASVKNSLIADGCRIEGTVENSVIFRDVHIGKNTVVRNCVILQDTTIGDGVNLNCVITDKNVVIGDGRNLSGHETIPFFIAKGMRI